MSSIIYSKTGSQGGQTDADVMYNLIQTVNKKLVASLSDITDSSTGTADTSTYALAAIPAVTPFLSVGTDMAQKAAVETALGVVLNAFKTTYAKANAAAVVAGLPQVVYSGTGTDGSGTIAAMTKSFTAVASSGVNAAGLNTLLATYRAVFMDLATFVNRICVATGVAPITTTLLATAYDATAIAATISTDTGTSSVTVSVVKAEADATFTAMANNIATIAAKFNLLTSDTVNSTIYVV